MTNVNLVMSLPTGIVTATSLGVAGFAWHRSPGTSGKFHGSTLLVDLPLKEGYPGFSFMDEGGWRNTEADTRMAIDAAKTGKRTKTALSNNAFNCIPLSAYSRIYLAKSSGSVLEMQPQEEIVRFKGHASAENLTPNQIAATAGLPEIALRRPRFYMVISPVEMMVLSNLTPSEYVWYATHRGGKVFRQMLFVELSPHMHDLAAREIYETAYRELTENQSKKTKTVTLGECFRRVPYSGWVGYKGEEGGLFGGNHEGACVWRFPKEIPHTWEHSN